MIFLPVTLRSSLIACLCCVFTSLHGATNELIDAAHGVRLPAGFRIQIFADDDLAHDIQCMTFDSFGRVVVSGPGYIKRLDDTDGDGKADKATLLAAPKRGAQGICFDRHDIIFYGEGAIWRIRDADFDDQPDGPPERLFETKGGEHGGHAIRKGPDGAWYFIGGNNSDITPGQINSSSTLIRAPEAGALMRFSPDFKQVEVAAHGFRNPYDFDFNADGEIFTYDSDCEHEFVLPWYTPTRLYHIAHGGHHGWRLPGHSRSWKRPDHYFDTIPALAPIGRGSPTGVVVYRHDRFPKRYRNGLFALDWTFGRIWFTPLIIEGATYQASPEIFLDPIGTEGFAPVDAEVGPTGALFVAIGGRGTRGAVFKIESTTKHEIDLPSLTTDPESAKAGNYLIMDQPLAAWSRARWMDAAKELGEKPFQAAAADQRRKPAERIRAIEICIELFGGLDDRAAASASVSTDESVRARTAWAIGQRKSLTQIPVLLSLAQDRHARPRLLALEAFSKHYDEADPDDILGIAPANLNHTDRRVRLAAIRLISQLPQESMSKLAAISATSDLRADIAGTLAVLQRNPQPEIGDGFHKWISDRLLDSNAPANTLDLLRVLMIFGGDWNLKKPTMESFTGHELAEPARFSLTARAKLTDSIRPLLTQSNSLVRTEAARVLCMLQDTHPATSTNLARLLRSASATETMQHLISLAASPAPLSPLLVTNVTDAILTIESRIDGNQQRLKQSWSDRLIEVTDILLKKNPSMGEAILAHPQLLALDNAKIPALLPRPARKRAAEKLLTATRANTNRLWTSDAIVLLTELPEAEHRPVFRSLWSHSHLRADILPLLANPPEELDRDRFVGALSSPHLSLVKTAVKALHTLPPDPKPERFIPLARLLLQLCNYPDEAAFREETLALFNKQSKQTFKFELKPKTHEELRVALLPLIHWLENKHATLSKSLSADKQAETQRIESLFATIDFGKGDPIKGKELYTQRSCTTCHGGTSTIGPDLAGASQRFSPKDLFNAILFPDRDIAPIYRNEQIVTRDGQSHTGRVVFQSANGFMLLTGPSQVIRLDESLVSSRSPSMKSLMPEGLLDGLKSDELADLYQYFRTLGKPTP